MYEFRNYTYQLVMDPITDQTGDFAFRLLDLAAATPLSPNTTVTGTLGQNGWYTSNVAVSFTVTDPESTISTQTGCDAVTVSTPDHMHFPAAMAAAWRISATA